MNERPSPEALLRRLREEEAHAGRGRLKIFFGASPGVGKTYAMLEEAQAKRREGVDVVVGLVETHGRAETSALLHGLEVLPRRVIEYRGVSLAELDLDAALTRRPALILVDELAHTNPPDSRHARRYQDIEELLAAGIDVHTTLNVQHLESLNDVVAQITGIRVRETVPDAILDRADELELADLSADDLLQRLREGKVYVPEQAARAIERFFRKGNLIALRELALRATAERVDEQMRGYMAATGIRATWPAGERVLVCVGPNPATSRVVRAGHRIAAGLDAEWFAIYIETPVHYRLPTDEREAVNTNLRLAEQLGATTVRLTGLSASDEILAWAQANNVTRIIVGKPRHPRWRDRLRGSLHDALIRGSGDMDVHVVTGDPGRERVRRARETSPSAPWREYGQAGVVILIATAISFVMRPVLPVANIAMTFLLAIAVVGARYGRGPTIAACLASIAIFDFCFVPPYYTFAVTDRAYIPTFGIMLAIALLMSALTAQIRLQATAARDRERRTAALYGLSRDLAAHTAMDVLAASVTREVERTMAGTVLILLPDATGQLVPVDPTTAVDERESAVARWVFDHAQAAGHDTETLPAAGSLWLPLESSGRVIGVLGLRPNEPGRLRDPAQRQLLDALVDQAAVAFDRAQLARRTEQARVEVEAERLRTALLSSLSHDLRTPLGTIEGSASTLLDAGLTIDEGTRRGLLQSILEESRRMTRLVANLLDMVKLETGIVEVNKEWQPLEEVVGIVLLRLEPLLKEREVKTHLPPDLPPVAIDGLLMEQVLINLLENALKYTPVASPIDIGAEPTPEGVIVEVADRGPGIAPDQAERVFGKFTRLVGEGGPRGAGLGLAICRGIVAAHGGRIWVEPRPGGGARFRFLIPRNGTPSSVALAVGGEQAAAPHASEDR
jgi:two-component system sensor histidine kinase KdpD